MEKDSDVRLRRTNTQTCRLSISGWLEWSAVNNSISAEIAFITLIYASHKDQKLNTHRVISGAEERDKILPVSIKSGNKNWMERRDLHQPTQASFSPYSLPALSSSSLYSLASFPRFTWISTNDPAHMVTSAILAFCAELELKCSQGVRVGNLLEEIMIINSKRKISLHIKNSNCWTQTWQIHLLCRGAAAILAALWCCT